MNLKDAVSWPVFHALPLPQVCLPHTKGHGRELCVAAAREGGGEFVYGEMSLGRIDLHMISTMMSHATSMTHILRTMPCKCWYTHQHAHHVSLLSKATSAQVITEADLRNKKQFINVHFIFSKHFSSVKTATFLFILSFKSSLKKIW